MTHASTSWVLQPVEHGAQHIGGLSLFGRAFGNDPQDLVLRVRHPPVEADPV